MATDLTTLPAPALTQHSDFPSQGTNHLATSIGNHYLYRSSRPDDLARRSSSSGLTSICTQISAMAGDTPKRVHFQDEIMENDRPTKISRTVRGISSLQQPAVVLALGFAVGTTSDDIRQALVASSASNVAQAVSPNKVKPTHCEILSIGPKVMAKLVYPNKATADSVVSEWNGANVDGCELLVWSTDDKPAFGTGVDAKKALSPKEKVAGPLSPINAGPGAFASIGGARASFTSNTTSYAASTPAPAFPGRGTSVPVGSQATSPASFPTFSFGGQGANSNMHPASSFGGSNIAGRLFPALTNQESDKENANGTAVNSTEVKVNGSNI